MPFFRDIVDITRPRVVGFVSVGHGINEFFSIVIPPIIPLLVTDLGITYAEAGLLLTMFFVMFSIFQLPAGILADRLGKGRLLLIGLAGMSVGIFIASLAVDFAMLLAGQAIAGMSGSTFHPAGMAMISDAETSTTEGRAMGVFGFGGKVGTMGAPLLVGGLAAVSGWRVALGGAAVLGLLVTLLLVVALVGPGGTVGPPTWVRPKPDGGRSGALAVDIRSLFKRLRISLSKEIALLFCITILIAIQSRAVQTFTTAYIVEGTRSSISIGNLGFFALLLGGGLSQPIAGSLADRFNRGLLGGIAAVSTVVLVGGTVFITRVSDVTSQAVLVAVMAGWLFVIGAAMYAMSPIKNALISGQAGEHYSGGLFGTIQTASALGGATGPVLFGVIATKWGILSAYPLVAFVSLLLSGLFFLVWWESRTGPP